MREERLGLVTMGITGTGGTYVLYWMSASPRTQDNMTLACVRDVKARIAVLRKNPVTFNSLGS